MSRFPQRTRTSADAAELRAESDRAIAPTRTEDQRNASNTTRSRYPLPDPTYRVQDAHTSDRQPPVVDGCNFVAVSENVASALPDRPRTTARSPILRRGDARLRTADLLNAALFRRWERGDEACSTRAIAMRCKVNPRTVHEYRHGEKAAPWALAWVLPIEIVEEINESIVSARAGGRTWRWALSLLRRGLDWIEERGLRPEDRHEARQALREAQRRIFDALERLDDEEGR